MTEDESVVMAESKVVELRCVVIELCQWVETEKANWQGREGGRLLLVLSGRLLRSVDVVECEEAMTISCCWQPNNGMSALEDQRRRYLKHFVCRK